MWKGQTIWPDIKAVLSNGSPLIVYDLETTGLSSLNDHIIEIAAVKFNVDENFHMTEISTYHQYINPGCCVSDKIVELTGITNEQLADKPLVDEVYPDLKAFFAGCNVSGYNIINFDNKFLSNLYGLHGDLFTPTGVVDGIVMARNRLTKTDVENYKLKTICDYYGFEINAHSAIEDARGTGQVIQQLINEYRTAEQENAKPKTVFMSLRPVIRSVDFWEGFRGFNRIYVNMDMGTIYYDIRSQTWGGKDIDVASLDMQHIEQEAFRLTECSSELEFRKFTGHINA